jgi:heparosan-N-sulfate-glucuronate 5-epimerase
MIRKRYQYLRRVGQAYLGGGRSQLSFWHETPAVNPNAAADKLGKYYMTFRQKADYAGPFDKDGIPLLDYRGVLGPQYNPIAISQYGLGNFNLFKKDGDAARRQKFFLVADWLVDHLEPNAHGLAMWMHHFNWEYRDTLIAPWYSALAQGQGLSVLVRAYCETREEKYKSAANAAYAGFQQDVAEGGVTFTDAAGDLWFEEYVVDPPTHILNGFMWASWGIYDYGLATGNPAVRELFARAVRTLKKNLHSYDTGYWSLYEHSGTRLPMLASRFYHTLHITQLKVMAVLTGEQIFREFADKWTAYAQNGWNTRRAFAMKALFKVCYY